MSENCGGNLEFIYSIKLILCSVNALKPPIYRFFGFASLMLLDMTAILILKIFINRFCVHLNFVDIVF